MDVMLDGKATSLPKGLKISADLLNWLEIDSTKPRPRNPQAVNKSRMVPGSLADTLDRSSGRGDLKVVVHESLPELKARVHLALKRSKVIVRSIENGDEDHVHAQLVDLLNSVRVMFTVFSRDLGWVDGPDAEISREDFSSTLERALGQLIRAQKSHLWVAICDVLEYEITPLLESWQKLVERTHAQIH